MEGTHEQENENENAKNGVMEEAQEKQDDKESTPSSVYEDAREYNEEEPSQGIWTRYAHSHPRAVSFCFGVVLPVWGLIFVAFIFGQFLSKLEAGSEIESNDATLAAYHFLSLTTSAFANVTARAPLVCLYLYIQNQTTNVSSSSSSFAQALFHDEDEFQEFIADTTSNSDDYEAEVFRAVQMQSQVDVYADSVIVDNDNNGGTLGATDFAKYLKECTKEAHEINQAFYKRLIVASGSVLANGMSFNWNRCVPSKKGQDLDGDGLIDPGEEEKGIILDGDLIGDVKFEEHFRFQEQRDHYAKTWNADWARLFDQYLMEEEQRTVPPTAESTSPLLLYLNARLRADLRATQDATGEDACDLHPESAAWFWFTVMTTIGYGNQAPVTRGGRALVYTLGFASIIVFAAVLGMASGIISAIIDDFLKRIKLRLLTLHWVGCLIWGAFWYTWMLVIAAYYHNWRRERLQDDEFELKDGYWFAYISTTTVGLGDFYLDPEVLIWGDLIVFPLLFLFGFVLLGMFLTKLSDLLFTASDPRTSTPLSVRLERTTICGLTRVSESTTDDNLVASVKKETPRQVAVEELVSNEEAETS